MNSMLLFINSGGGESGMTKSGAAGSAAAGSEAAAAFETSMRQVITATKKRFIHIPLEKLL
jgi:hypothetical protein